MATIVLDSTAALGVVLSDSADAVTNGAITRIGRLLVPPHWHQDVADALRAAERSGRLPHGAALEAAVAIEALGVATDHDPGGAAWGRILDLACRHRLHLYEAAYLELALRGGHALATLDPRLAEAAENEGIITLP